MTSLYKLVLWLALIVPAVSYAQTKKQKLTTAPHFVTIENDADVSALSMDCEGSAPFNEVKCTFSQLRVRKRSDEDLKKQSDAFQADYKNASEGDFKKQFNNLCSKQISEAKKDGSHPLMGPEKKAFVEANQRDLQAICSCSDKTSNPTLQNRKDCVAKALESVMGKENTVCIVSNNSFELTFKRAGERKWISNPGPKGLCNLVNVTTIEHEVDSTMLWTFSQTRVTADTDSELCKHFEFNKPTIYSWKVSSGALLKCEVIKFGVL